MTAVAFPVGGHVRATDRLTAKPRSVDTGFVLGLVFLGLVGFGPIYSGHLYLLVGMVGALLGVAVTELSLRLRQPVLAEAAVAILVFLLFGGATNGSHHFPLNVVPTASSIAALGHVGIYGWKDLLTSTIPIGNGSNLLAIPYVVGLIGAVSGQSLARRTRSSWLALAGPVLVLSLGILFGARHPASLLLQGSLFSLLGLLWVILRYHRTRVVIAGPGFARNRLAMSAAILAIVGVSAGVVGANLPGAESHSRVVLSQFVVPPFEAVDQPSPLAGFRQYVPQGPLNKKALFTVSGLPEGSEIRISTMDEYDGIAWGFGAGSGDPGTSADTFRHYGSTVEAQGPGREVRVHVTIGQLGSIWLPEVGEITRLTVAASDSASLTDDFLYDPDTETAAVPSGLQPGESYTVETDVVPPLGDQKTLDSLSVGSATIPVSGVPQNLQTDANSWSTGASGPYAKVMAIANQLKTTGYYSDGLEVPPLSLPGHSTGRLTEFLQGGPLVGSEIVGDGEQYAATLALMANAIDVPTRVVLGATVGSGGVVTGQSVEPWVEVDLAGVGWQPIYSDEFMDPTRKAQETPPTQSSNHQTPTPVEPPVVSALHTPLDGQLPGGSSSSLSHFAHATSGPFLPAWVTTTLEWVLPVVVVLLAFSFGVTWMKRRRRYRRRHHGLPAAQVVGAWNELVDLTRDLGIRIPTHLTRRGQARFLVGDEAAKLAARGDAAVFGPDQPSETEVTAYWTAVDIVTWQVRSGLGWLARWRLRVSIRSLLPAAGGPDKQ